MSDPPGQAGNDAQETDRRGRPHERRGERTRRGQPRALLVDDNPMHQMLAAALLKERGYAVTQAGDGLEALELFEAAEFDLVLLDLSMPRLDGFQTAERMRRLEAGRLRRAPIIAVTSMTSDGDRERCLAAGMDEHVAKPIDPGALDAALATHAGDEPADFHFSRALERVSWDEAALAAVARHFLAEAPARLEAMHAALDQGDAETLGTAAHTLEAKANELAMPRLRDLAHRIAVLSGQGDFERAAALTEELETAFGRGSSALARIIESA